MPSSCIRENAKVRRHLSTVAQTPLLAADCLLLTILFKALSQRNARVASGTFFFAARWNSRIASERLGSALLQVLSNAVSQARSSIDQGSFSNHQFHLGINLFDHFLQLQKLLLG